MLKGRPKQAERTKTVLGLISLFNLLTAQFSEHKFVKNKVTKSKVLTLFLVCQEGGKYIKRWATMSFHSYTQTSVWQSPVKLSYVLGFMVHFIDIFKCHWW